MASVIDQLADFVSDAKFAHRRWLHDDFMSVYVRRSNHAVNGQILDCLDIANVEVKQPGRGHFSKHFMPAVIRINPWDAVYAENVLTPRFAAWFRREGWKTANFLTSPSFVWLKQMLPKNVKLLEQLKEAKKSWVKDKPWDGHEHNILPYFALNGLSKCDLLSLIFDILDQNPNPEKRPESS